MEYPALLARLERLLRETYALWEAGWVAFNWRAYSYDHVQRVRALALNLCRSEGGDATVAELAALLHDITKPYDGEYVTHSEGNRIVDAQGYWRNQARPPIRSNRAIALYQKLGLAGQPHNESGAALAHHLLREHGVDRAVCARVAQTIRDHLRPAPDVPTESRCLYDADTIDANIGLPAFVRNIYIHLHYRDRRRGPDELPTDALLRERPLGYLRPYISENLPRWSEGKRRDFLPRLLTPSGRKTARARLEHLAHTWDHLTGELDRFATGSSHGCLAVILHFMRHRDDPSIAEETAYLAGEWLTANQATPQARGLVSRLVREMKGLE